MWGLGPTIDMSPFITFKNWGQVINAYSNTSIKLPSIFSLSYSFENNTYPVSLFTSYKRRLDLKQAIIHITLKLSLNQKLSLYLSNRSDKSNLFFDKL